MTALIVKLIITLALLIFAVQEIRITSDKVSSSLCKLDHLTTGDYGYFAAVQRYYDSRKVLVFNLIFAWACSTILFTYLFKVVSLLNN